MDDLLLHLTGPVELAAIIIAIAAVLLFLHDLPAHVHHFTKHPSGLWGCGCGEVRDRHGNDPHTTTYWYDGQQVTAHDYQALREQAPDDRC